MVLVEGIEPPFDDYESTVMPLYYTSINKNTDLQPKVQQDKLEPAWLEQAQELAALPLLVLEQQQQQEEDREDQECHLE